MKNYKLPVISILVTLLTAALPASGSLHEQFPNTPDRPWKVSRYLGNYQYLAVQLQESYGIPLAISFGVAGLESDFGLSSLALQSNNHFGIKNTDWEGAVHCQYTSEWMPEGGFLPVKACFRKYPLIADSYRDFALFLTGRSSYQDAFGIPRWDYTTWAWHLQEGGYATDPRYATKLIQLIERYHLYLLDQ